MPTLAAAKAANAAVAFTASPAAQVPVALFVGGTSGIGQGAAEAFARYTKGNAHIIISGRNEEAAQAIIDSFPKHPSSKYEFLPCDVSRLANVTAACKELTEKRGLSKLNYLFMSPGFVTVFGGFEDNSEGIDRKFGVHYYARFKFFNELAPLLQAAKDAGEEARVVSVLMAGHGTKADLSDLGLKNTYTVAKCTAQAATYTSLTIEELTKKYPDFSFTHIYPGFVKTPITNGSLVTKVIAPFANPFATSVSDCSEWMMRPLFDPAMAKGAFHLDNHADPYPASKLHLGQEAQTTVFNHLMEAISKL